MKKECEECVWLRNNLQKSTMKIKFVQMIQSNSASFNDWLHLSDNQESATSLNETQVK